MLRELRYKHLGEVLLMITHGRIKKNNKFCFELWLWDFFFIIIICVIYSLFVCLFQFTQWVDAVIFVFSLENEVSFQSVYTFYAKMAHFRNTAEIPLILVGTQGKKGFCNKIHGSR